MIQLLCMIFILYKFYYKGFKMNADTLKGNWKQLKGNIQKKWGELTDDDLDVIEGNANILAGKLQEKYGMSKEKAEEAIEKFED